MKITKKIQRLTIILVTLLMTTASWGQTYTVSIETATGGAGTGTMSAKHGTTDIVSGSTAVNPGETVTLTASPESGYYLSALNVEAYSDAGYAAGRTRTIPNTPTMTGSVPVTQTGANTYTFTMPVGYVKVTPTFSESTDLSTATILLTEGTPDGSGNYSRVYDWVSHTPVIASVKIGENVLTKNVDYTEAAISSIENVGFVTIRVDGKGIYKGSRQITYSITQRSLSSDTYITLGYETTVYNKSEQKPSVAVQTGGHTLTVSSDYTVGYSVVQSGDDFIKPGTKRITITGTGNFTGSTSKDYTITPKPITSSDISVTQNGTSYTYNGNPQYPTITVTDGTVLTYNTDYTLNWSSGGNVQVPTSPNSTAVGNYTVTVNGINNYTGSVTKQYTINASNSGYYIVYKNGNEYSITDHNETYTGSEITLVPGTRETSSTTNMIVMKMTGSTPAPATDDVLAPANYELAYTNNINSGWATVTAIGKAGYSFVASNKFKIEPKSVNGLTITLSRSSFEYNGKVQKPEVTVKDGETPLYLGRDYELTNDGGKDVGTTYIATIKGIGNYKDSKTSDNYSITALTFSNVNTNITLSNSNYIYNGDAKTPEIVQVVINGNVIPSTDYQPTYSNNTAAGTATVTIEKSSSNNLAAKTTVTNFATKEFNIDQKSIANVEITLTPSSFTFKNGVNQKPTSVVVVDKERGTSGVELTPDTDYSLTNNGGINAGVYDVTVTGAGNYKGTATKSYVINETSQSSAISIADIPDQTYTGSVITPTPTITYTYDTNNTVTLIKDQHYTLSYLNNINVGSSATVIVTLKGGYTGTDSKTFNIVARSLASSGSSDDGATITANTSFTYNGNVQKPTFTVIRDNRQLAAGVDYDVTYNGDAISAGTQNVTITGNGNYTGSKTGSYTINQLSLSTATIKLPYEEFVYNRAVQEPTPVVNVGSLVISSNDFTTSWDDDNNTTTTSPNLKDIGTKYITVTGNGNCKDSKTTTYKIVAKQIDASMVTLENPVMTYTGSALNPGITVKDGEATLTNDTEYTVTLTNNTNVGTATVTVQGIGNYTGTVQKTFSIIPEGAEAFDIAWTGGSAPSPTYDGTEHKPEVKVTKHGSTTDELQTSDYDVEYSNNINAGTNTASVTVTGKGNYSGTQTLHFTIAKKEMTNDMLTLTGGPFTYDGTIKKPTVAVSDPAGANLIKADDYVISNEGNINAGEYTVTATATSGGNYSGSSSQTYTISPYTLTTENTTITLNQTSLVYDGTAKTPEVQLVKVGSDLVVPTYTTVYANNTNAAAATAATAPQVTVTGTGNFTGSAVKKFTITPKTVTTDMILFDQENFTYNAAVQKPVVTVKDGDKTLTVNTDYTLTNEGGTNIGTYYAQIEGKGNYQGTAKRGYSIVTDGASMFTVNDIESVTYDGTEKTPEVVVLDNVKTAGTTLTENVHYTKNYINNKNAGIASVIITGIGSYAGTITKNFTINPKALTEEMVVLAENSFAFNSLQQKPTVTVSDGTIMTENDYTITNNGGVNCGTYHVVVTGKGNYTGEIDKTFTITQLDISTGTVTLYELQSYAYDGKPKKPGVREIIVGKVTVPTTGFTTSYGDNINVGKGTVTVTGQGDFRGTKTVEFEIIKKTITADMITLSNQEYTYNGSTHKPEVTVKDGETTLKLGTDYTLTNNGGVNAGTYDVTITGIGNYTGSVTKNFTIRVQEAGVFVMSLSQESMVFTGSELKPVVTVKDSEKTLTEGTHYTVTYNNNINVGVATVMVEGIGQYKGSKMKTFIITPKTLTDAMVTLSSSEFTYNVMQQRPVVTVQDGSSLTLNDYVVTNDGGVNVGTYKVTVIGKNNYMGSVEKSFSISSLDISEAKVILYELANYVYDGTAKNPGVREVGIGTIVVPTSSYTSEISDNVNAGKVTVTVTGSGNFSGSASTSFNILQKPLSEEMVSLDKTSFPYNEKKQKPVVTVSDGNIMTEADYTITNEGGTEEGTYDVIVTGKNNYTGTITKKYDIIRSDMPVDVKPGDENPGADDAIISVTPVSKGSNEVKVSDIKTTESESVTIPETCTINGQTYTITGIADGAFANASNLKDLYLPETEEPLTIGKDAIPAAANVHVPLSLLAQYALMPAMAENFRNGKVMTTVKAKNRYWTFSSGVDVYVPEGLDVYIAREHNDYSVSIIQLTDNELAVGGQRVIKANNGVLINSSGNDTPYTFVACPKRMTSGTAITTDDNKDYGLRNCLIPVIVATHFESGNYYFMKNNEFYRITDESEDIKVPAGKAVLYLKSAKASARVRLVNGTTDISSETIEDQQDEWYTIEGLKLDGRPTKEGIYIHNKKKVYIRK